jgi:mRNA-degrading endonuclease toxin of MazEF toxin-antitoxin module
MTYDQVELDKGDLVWVDFDPVRGTEQSGARPALVISQALFHTQTPRAIVCPITRNITPWPTKVFLPEGLAVHGAVLVDQVRSVDRATRGFRRVGKVPDQTLREVRHKLGELIGLSLKPPG